MKILGVIPARFASTRFPGKPLALINGKPMIEHVYARCLESGCFSKVVVATDSTEIEKVVKLFNGNVVLTNPNHPSGTDRCFEALFLESERYDAVINIQGDEPFIDPKSILKVANLLKKGASIATLAVKIHDYKMLLDSNKVKVVLSNKSEAIYFSRAAIPFQRDVTIENWLTNTDYFVHLGLYGFSSAAVREITKLNPSLLEQLECLEQLRWIDNGLNILVDIVESAPLGIDTPEDLKNITNLISKGLINF